jgi:hypothetical protein
MKMFSAPPSFWADRLRASTLHLGLSLCVAASAAFLVFGIWYPYPYREISGGRELFMLVVAVDVILGPLITLAVFNRTKSWTELRRDLALVGMLQMAALGYGLWTVAVARPVHMVFEIDRFRVVHAIDVDPALLSQAPMDVIPLPWTGPSLLGLRAFKDAKEGMDATMAALQGVQLAFRPDLWQTYEKSTKDVLKEAKPLATLITRFPAQGNAILGVAQDAGRKAEDLVYLPMIGRKSFWTVFLDPTTAQIVAFMPLDSF